MSTERFSWLKKDNRQQLEWVAGYIRKYDPQAQAVTTDSTVNYRSVKKMLVDFVADKPGDNTRENGYRRQIRISGAWQQQLLRQNIRSGQHDKVIYQTHLPQEAVKTLKKLAEKRGKPMNTTLAEIIMQADKPEAVTARPKTEQQMHLGF